VLGTRINPACTKKEEAIPVGTASFILYKIKKEKNLF